jgi:hypothetical protein
MRHRPVILRRPAPAQSIEGVISFLLQLVAVFEALYRVFISLFGGAS